MNDPMGDILEAVKEAMFENKAQHLESKRFDEEVHRRLCMNKVANEQTGKELADKYPDEMGALGNLMAEIRGALDKEIVRANHIMKLLPESLRIFFIENVGSVFKCLGESFLVEEDIRTGKFKLRNEDETSEEELI